MKKIALFVLLIASTVLAQKGTITGKVSDAADGSPLIGANVVLEGTSQGAATDAEGRYTILQVDAGEYSIMVSYIGYKILKKDAMVTTGEILLMDLELEPEVIQMETYVVTASRRRERVEDAPAKLCTGLLHP